MKKMLLEPLSVQQDSEHYLEAELHELLAADFAIFNFIEQGSLDGIWLWDLNDPENEYMSPRFWEVLGYDPKAKQHRASEWQDIINQDDLARALENFNKHCEDSSHPYDQLVRYKHANGSTVWIRCRGMVIRDENDVPYRMLGAHNDLTPVMQLRDQLADMDDLQQTNNELNELVRHDSLTGLSNQIGFEEALNNEISVAREFGSVLAVLSVGIKGLSQYNDTYGRLAGDVLLKELSAKLSESLREKDILARFDGARFYALLLEVNTDKVAEICVATKKAIESGSNVELYVGYTLIDGKKMVDRQDIDPLRSIYLKLDSAYAAAQLNDAGIMSYEDINIA